MEKATSGDITLLFLDASHFVMGCDFLGNVIQSSEHIITLASGKRPDEPPGFPVYVPKEVAPHNKMGSVKEKQDDIP